MRLLLCPKRTPAAGHDAPALTQPPPHLDETIPFLVFFLRLLQAYSHLPLPTQPPSRAPPPARARAFLVQKIREW